SACRGFSWRAWLPMWCSKARSARCRLPAMPSTSCSAPIAAMSRCCARISRAQVIEPARALSVVLHLLLLARARDALDLRHRTSGFFRHLAVLLDQKTVRRLVAVEAAEQRARHLAVGALRAVLIDHVEHDELGIQSRFSRHDCSPCSCSLILVR